MIKLKKLTCVLFMALFLNSSIYSADVDNSSNSKNNRKKSSFLGSNIAKVAGLGTLIAAGTAAAYSKGAPLYPDYAGGGNALPWGAGLTSYDGDTSSPSDQQSNPDQFPSYDLTGLDSGKSWMRDTSFNDPWSGYHYNNDLEPINESSAGSPEMLQNAPYAELQDAPAITTNSDHAENNYLEPENGPYAGPENEPANAAPSYMQQAKNFAGQQWNNLTGFLYNQQ